MTETLGALERTVNGKKTPCVCVCVCETPRTRSRAKKKEKKKGEAEKFVPAVLSLSLKVRTRMRAHTCHRVFCLIYVSIASYQRDQLVCSCVCVCVFSLKCPDKRRGDSERLSPASHTCAIGSVRKKKKKKRQAALSALLLPTCARIQGARPPVCVCVYTSGVTRRARH